MIQRLEWCVRLGDLERVYRADEPSVDDFVKTSSVGMFGNCAMIDRRGARAVVLCAFVMSFVVRMMASLGFVTIVNL
jgi:hypothetical protein